MFPFITILLIGVSLSMDAFSLALGFGMGNKRQHILELSLIVGIFHFFMPIIGNCLGEILNNISIVSVNLLASLILLYLGFELLISNFKEECEEKFSNSFMFALSVSIDSLTLGIGLRAITDNIILSAVIFSICSFSFTLLGLIIGKVLGDYMGKYSKILGGIILIILSFVIFYKKY